ncbi:hypothetical protein ACWEOW_18700 [Monashia sp. NPDC004114]
MDTSSHETNLAAAVENPHAGRSAVLLDIGGDVGALVVRMPTNTVGLEVEIRPAGSTQRGGHHHYPHVAVVPRPTAFGVAPTLVYPSVHEGDYELFPLPAGPVAMTATVSGGGVTRATWPD